jgi:hypothetical protein
LVARFDRHGPCSLNATTCYDIGLFFSTDADPIDNGALTGTCSITTLPTSPDTPFVNLDGDQCGGTITRSGSATVQFQ